MKQQLTAYIHNKLKPILAKYNVSNQMSIDVQTPPDRSKGDYSMNAAMKLAKAAKCPPRQLAEEIVEAINSDDKWFEKIEIAGPGFINLYLKNSMIIKQFCLYLKSENIDLKGKNKPQKVVIDYSSVNIAKQMHVGHLRSTVIGDVLARVLEAHGDEVIRQNHLGDWGLPIAMVLYKAMPIIDEAISSNKNLDELITLEDLENFYKETMNEAKNNKDTAQKCNEVLFKLQQGDKELLNAWKMITELSMNEVYRIYKLLDIKLHKENERGESFYRDKLDATLQEIENSGKLEESQGAKCVFLEQFKSKDKKPLPMIVVKSDGAYNYGTFDLAAVKYRSETLKADRAIYVTDARQALHFKQVFAVAKACGLAKNDIKLEHVTFGTILGENNKPIKTRSGENIKLVELLNEAVDKAYEVVNEKNQKLTEEQKREVARIVGIGAIKYTDLSQNRNNDYVFSFDRMLALNGNTAPYLQYAHARICSIFRKAKLERNSINSEILIESNEERELIMKLMELPQIVAAVSEDLRPHILCNYVYEVAVTFSSFYNKCPVLNCDNEKIKLSRLAICDFTGKILERSLDLLGITAPQEM